MMIKAIDQSAHHSLLLIHLELFLVVAIWAGTFVATKVVLMELSPAISALYRYIIASIILLLIDYRNPERIKREDYPLIVFLAATGVTLYYLFQHYGIKYTNATEASVLISLSPIFIGLISWGILGEKPNFTMASGLVLSFLGCAAVITDGNLTIFQSSNEHFRGNLLILLTAVVWALYSVYGKKMLARYSARTIIKYTTIIGTCLIIPFSISEIGENTNLSISWMSFLNLLYLGGLASVYGYLAWYRGLEHLSALTVGSYLYFRPFLTGIIAAAILHEQVSCYTVAGGIMIIIGTYLATKK